MMILVAIRDEKRQESLGALAGGEVIAQLLNIGEHHHLDHPIVFIQCLDRLVHETDVDVVLTKFFNEFPPSWRPTETSGIRHAAVTRPMSGVSVCAR
ncbi:hypothetical protein [Halocatena marina]|uniref:hypothetical protein n=1 Tax=Halocatena marina TaxID=2934937 RepID=UPI00281653F7|nr:hypothetical protein [Halocatena marina]